MTTFMNRGASRGKTSTDNVIFIRAWLFGVSKLEWSLPLLSEHRQGSPYSAIWISQMLHLFTFSLAIITIPVWLTPIILYCREAFPYGTLVIFTWRSPLEHLVLTGYLLLSANLCVPWFQLHLPELYRSVFLYPCFLNILIPIWLTQICLLMLLNTTAL